MKREKLAADWKKDPCLSFLAFDSVEELAEHLRKCHETLMGPRGGPFGYLYQQQTRRLRELQKELSDGQKRR